MARKLIITIPSTHPFDDALNREDNLSLDDSYEDGNPVHKIADTSAYGRDPLDILISRMDDLGEEYLHDHL